jgi:hypothetical protein
MHVPYLVRYETEDGNKAEFIGDNLVVNMLNSLPTNVNILMIAHNANYDCRFLLRYLTHDKVIVKGNRFLSVKGVYYRNNNKNTPIQITIKDSYRMIPMPLRDFGSCFNLTQSKEIMPYKLYTEENIKKQFIDINYALQYVPKQEQEQFITNIEKWDCKSNTEPSMYDIIKYSSKYCEIDCNVLRLGYETFRKWILEHTNLDIDIYITIQSVVSAYKLYSGCYDNVCMLSGVVQHYISNCIVGGRCMTKNNQSYHVIDEIDDFDACSLYPSAIARMSGYLQGKPKILTNLTYEFLKKQDGYFIRVKILKIGKTRQFPLLSKYRDDGVRHFTNDMLNEIIYIDKVGLEDLIKYQEIEFEIIDGYYFDEGRNNKIKDVINKFYKLRLELKKSKNPA